jgi:hypothetical protein
MRIDDTGDVEAGPLHFGQNPVRVVARVNDRAGKGLFTSYDKTIGLNRPYG